MWLWSTAFALPPTGNPGFIPVGAGNIERMDISSDGELVAGRDRSTGSGWVLSIDSWIPRTAAPCAVSGVALVPYDDDHEVYFSCDDGTVHVWEYVAGALRAVVDDEGEPYVFQVTADSAPLVGLWWDRDPNQPWLYALEQVDGGGVMHVLDPRDGLLDGSLLATYDTLPITPDGFREGVVSNGSLYIGHGGRRVTIVNLTTGGVSYSPTSTGAFPYDIDDFAAGGTKLWAVDTEQGVLFEFNPTVGTFGLPTPGFEQPRAVVANLVAGDEWILISGDGIWIHDLENGFLGPALYVNEDAEIHIQDAVSSAEYTFGGGGAGNVQIITAKPWVDEVAIEPSAGTAGDAVRLTFRVDREANWIVALNGDRTGTGAVITSGSTTADDQLVELDLTVGDNWLEGTNQLYVVATNDALQKGHGRADFVVDRPPGPPGLTNANLSFADRALNLSFDGIADADLERYDIWISDVPWSADDYPTGAGGPPGPEGGPSTPISVTAEGGARVNVRLAPLQNGTTYHVGVRSYDAAGAESAMSRVIQGTPEPDYRASDLAGETGGGPCSTGGGPVTGWLALAGLAALRRRALLGAGLLVLTGTAQADDDVPSGSRAAARDKGDLTTQKGNFELRYGGFTSLADENIKAVYGDGGHNMLQLEFGPQLYRFVEVDVELGFYQELATTVSGGGAGSSVKTMLTWFPLGLSGTARLQLLDEQLVVPHARLGFDYVLFTELTDDGTGGKDKVAGSKLGHHYAIGGSLLLDLFAPGRASLLEAQTGINDTYLVVEWRRQNVDSRDLPWAAAEVDGFDFSGSMLTVGLKLDY
jgi:hypothetical protein